MKKFLLTLLMLLPFFAIAQNKSTNETPKYLEGAVPLVDGKVVFTKNFTIPGASKSDIFKLGTEWLENTLSENQRSNIIANNPEKGEVAGINEHYLVFRSSALSLDRATISYMIKLSAKDGECTMNIERIKYLYNNPTNNVPDKYTAEEWIVDSYALNKARTKVASGIGKFRIKTIDLVDELADKFQKDINSHIITTANNRSATPVTQTVAAQTVPAVATTPINTAISEQPSNIAPATNYNTTTTVGNNSSNNNMSGYNKISPDKIPGNIIKMLSQDWMLITAGNDSKFNTMTASWGGLGVLFNKPVAICFINPSRYTYQLMESGDTYTLTFYTEAYREALNYCGKVSGKDTDKIKGSGLTPITTPDGSKAFSQAWLVIECRKLVSQSLSLDGINNAAEKEKRSTQPMHKMYIGEIINVWVK